ncbi:MULTISPECIES: sterol desaturase family protein [Kordiimonas]|jgi:sterol desaturase/sphingolipid hydroxylase (fatty acid hydroxylase superfamily)|uniref:sterol desaturase family protein n=1 Tax=Kordiimonas TaxID=288021 RepID=UPI00257E6EE4|nr:sterol desaturase family protein [Kordiimonas sp. UBA4487]
MELAGYFIIFVTFVVVFTFEVIAPASGNDCDKRWQIYAGAISGFQIVVALAAGYLFSDWFAANAVFHLDPGIPVVVAAFLVFLAASLIAYWWHRATHRYDLLWRVFHQLHHSPARIEALTAFYVHPFDGFAANVLNVGVAFWLFGAGVDVAAAALLIAALYNIYIHSDTRSPEWVGYFVQRPEMHRVHHQAGHHAQNYGLPIWDLMFGTFVNPKKNQFACGFDKSKELRIRDMLLLKDVDG